MLSAPVVDAVVAAWRTHDRLVAAGRATATDLSKTELIDLSSTEVTSKSTWTIEVTVGAPRISIDFTLTVVFDLHVAVATVRGGRIISIGDGHGEVHATFCAIGQVLADRQMRIDLHDHLRFDPGLLLARPEAAKDRPGVSPEPQPAPHSAR